jgi:hypothetical protein
MIYGGVMVLLNFIMSITSLRLMRVSSLTRNFLYIQNSAREFLLVCDPLIVSSFVNLSSKLKQVYY